MAITRGGKDSSTMKGAIGKRKMTFGEPDPSRSPMKEMEDNDEEEAKRRMKKGKKVGNDKSNGKIFKKDHMEQVLHFLHEIILPQKVIILDGFWVNQISTHWEHREAVESSDRPHKIMLNYYEGLLPQGHGKNWDDAEHIYVPFNLKSKYWVALKINLTDWCVDVYDCPGVVKDSALPKLLELVMNGLPLVLKLFQPLAKVVDKWGDKPLNVTCVTRLKSNIRGGDCGVYTLKYIEFLSTGRSNLKAIADKFMDGYRNSLVQSV